MQLRHEKSEKQPKHIDNLDAVLSMIKKLLLLGTLPMLMIGLLISQVDVRTDITDFFFTGHDPDSAFLINQLTTDKLQRETILSIEHQDLNAEVVVDFMDQFRSDLATLPGMQRVWSESLSERQLIDLINLYSAYKVNLFSIDPQLDIPELFEADNLNARLLRMQSLLLGPDPQRVKSLIKSDPMLLTLDWLEAIQLTFTRSKTFSNYSVVFVESVAQGMDLNAQQNLQQLIFESFTQLNQKFENKFTMQTTGIPVFAMAIKSQVSKDISRVSTLSMLVILLLFIVIFRSAKSLMLTASLLVITVGSAVLITQLVFGFVHGLTLALGATLIGVCIDYFIHAMINASEGEASQYSENIVKIWPSLILGGMTTVLGYIALAVSGFPGLQQIAVFAISGIFIALLMTRFIIPVLMLQFSLKLRPRFSSEKLLSILSSGKLAGGIVIAVLICFSLGVWEIKWSDSLDTLSPDLKLLKTKDNTIRSRMVDLAPGRFVLAQANDMETALELNEKLFLELNQLRDQGAIESYFSVYPWMASQRLQSENKRIWNETLTAQNIKNWEAALQASGFAAQAFPALKKSESEFIDSQRIKSTPAWPLLSKQLINDGELITVVTWLGRHDVNLVKQALSAIPGVRYFSHKESIDALARDYRIKAQTMLLAGLAAIYLLLLGRFRSVWVAFKLLLPAVTALLFVFGIAGIIGRPMHMIHLIGLLLTAAICVDYGIFFFENRSNNRTLTFQAISASALTSGASFASLGIAQNPGLQALAWTVAPGIFIGFLLCPVILRKGQNRSDGKV